MESLLSNVGSKLVRNRTPQESQICLIYHGIIIPQSAVFFKLIFQSFQIRGAKTASVYPLKVSGDNVT